MKGERIFQILAALLAGIAAYFLWKRNFDAMFASAVAGACCFFLSYRFQVKERLQKRQAEYEAAQGDENSESPNTDTTNE